MAPRRGSASRQLGMAVLAYLSEKPRHPYELVKLFKERDVQESIPHKHASLYMVIDQLHRDGHIEPVGTQREGQRPERTIYRPTESGKAELRDRMSHALLAIGEQNSTFQGALSVIAALPPDEVVTLLDERERALADQIKRLREHVKRGHDVNRLFLIEHEYRLNQLHAEHRFVRRFKAAIDEDQGSLASFWKQLQEHIET